MIIGDQHTVTYAMGFTIFHLLCFNSKQDVAVDNISEVFCRDSQMTFMYQMEISRLGSTEKVHCSQIE